MAVKAVQVLMPGLVLTAGLRVVQRYDAGSAGRYCLGEWARGKRYYNYYYGDTEYKACIA